MKILFVDDERNMLTSIRRLMIQYPYETFYLESGGEALEFLKSNHVDVIVSDSIMPGMTGAELLGQIKEAYPDTVRVVLSGYSEADEVWKALLKGTASFYIFKPVEPEKLNSAMQRVAKFKEVILDKHVQALISSTGSLPVLSTTQQQIINHIQQDTPVEKLALFIEEDVMASSNIMRLANASHYGFREPAISVQQSVIRVGMQTLKGMIYSLSVLSEDTMTATAREGVHKLLEKARLTNEYFHLLHKKVCTEQINPVFDSMGLILDIGLLFIYTRMEQEVEEIARGIRAKRYASFLEGEQAVLGASHTDIGAQLLGLWSFPQFLVEAALYHHSPLEEDVPEELRYMLTILNIADHYAWEQVEIGEWYTERTSDEVYQVAGISREEVADILGSKSLEGGETEDGSRLELENQE